MTKSTFTEFFCGIGLVRLALEGMGWRCVFANDIDPKKAEIYQQNFGKDDLRVADIRSLKASDVPRAQLATATFPCVDLSLAGNRAGLAGSESGAFWLFVRLLQDLSEARRLPDSVMLENVPGFLTSHGGRDFHEAVRALNDLGYTCDAVMLNAASFVPQSRPRLFVFAARDGAIPALRPLRLLEESSSELRPPALESFIRAHSRLRWGRLDFPAPPRRDVNIADVLERPRADSRLWWSAERTAHLVSTMRPLDRARAEALRASPRMAFGTVYRRTRYGNAVAELRTDGLAGCLRTARGGSSKQFLLVGYRGTLRARGLTPREYARLQGVPDSFRIDVPENQALFALGDAVCVPAVQWLLGQVFDVRRAAA